jgi:fermentation-respiration switch protein FrsA (DUF1100 family)
MKKITVWFVIVVLAVLMGVLVGGGFYMLDVSLSPDPTRANTDSCYRQLFTDYPETREWMDSLRTHHALRDTMIVMPGGYRLHTYYINRGSQRTAMVIHGWRDQAIKFFFLARMYERLLGYNVVMPDLYASGQSDGEALRMGWLDRLDVLQLLNVFKTDTVVVHGVSMGAATTMMMSGEQMPEGIRDLRFVADCGYTSVWDEFAGELKNQFDLPAFPLMYTPSLLCQLRYGWNFTEASALRQVAKCQYPMFFIHGDKDDFVPTYMVRQLYDAKSAPKDLWITKNTDHAHSYKNHGAEYVARVRRFLE